MFRKGRKEYKKLIYFSLEGISKNLSYPLLRRRSKGEVKIKYRFFIDTLSY